MEFTNFHKDFFSATSGSFSRVTNREYVDSQVTLTDFESSLVISHYGIDNIHVGNVQSGSLKAKKRFLLYPHFDEIFLNLVFPKPDKPELRLYLSSKNGYKPQGGEIWFLYENKEGDLVIGSLQQKEWDKIGQIDFEDELYQNSIENLLIKEDFEKSHQQKSKISVTTIASKTIYVRDPKLAVLRFQEVGYACEIDPSHKTFTSLATNLPYMEAHHFIPIKFQATFKESLDTIDNIVCLCPTCHRGIHHATVDYKINLINNLYNKRPEIHRYALEEIAQYYNCLKLP